VVVCWSSLAAGNICCHLCRLVSFEQFWYFDFDQQEVMKSSFCIFPVSRKKFAQLARVFTRRKKRSSAKNILSQGPAPSRDNLLLNAEPLLDGDDDDDDDSVPDSYDTMRRPEHRE
jgi:hypothetical protein